MVANPHETSKALFEFIVEFTSYLVASWAICNLFFSRASLASGKSPLIKTERRRMKVVVKFESILVYTTHIHHAPEFIPKPYQ